MKLAHKQACELFYAIYSYLSHSTVCKMKEYIEEKISAVYYLLLSFMIVFFYEVGRSSF